MVARLQSIKFQFRFRTRSIFSTKSATCLPIARLPKAVRFTETSTKSPHISHLCVPDRPSRRLLCWFRAALRCLADQASRHRAQGARVPLLARCRNGFQAAGQAARADASLTFELELLTIPFAIAIERKPLKFTLWTFPPDTAVAPLQPSARE